MSEPLSLNERAEPTKYRLDLVAEDICPRCRGQIDTGWECIECGYDAKWIAEREAETK